MEPGSQLPFTSETLTKTTLTDPRATRLKNVHSDWPRNEHNGVRRLRTQAETSIPELCHDQTQHRGGCVSHWVLPEYNNKSLNKVWNWLLPDIFNLYIASLALLSPTLANVVALSCIACSRIFSMDHKSFDGTFCMPQHPETSTASGSLLVYHQLADRDLKAVNGVQLLNPSRLTVITPKCLPIRCVSEQGSHPIEVTLSTHAPSSSESKVKDSTFVMHALLRKHYKYLLPWLSNQPETPVEEASVERLGRNADNETADQFRRLSLHNFAELSAVIYSEVRRREEILPESAQPSMQEPWTRNKQNEARMVLCRVVKKQYHRLVMAVVLEQARRLAEIRIRLYRRHAIAKGWN